MEGKIGLLGPIITERPDVPLCPEKGTKPSAAAWPAGSSVNTPSPYAGGESAHDGGTGPLRRLAGGGQEQLLPRLLCGHARPGQQGSLPQQPQPRPPAATAGRGGPRGG